MRNYLYDGTPLGLLTALAKACGHQEESRLLPPGGQPGLFGLTETVTTDPGLVNKFWKCITQKLPPEITEEIFYSLFATGPETGEVLLSYLRLLFRRGVQTAADWTDPRVRAARRLAGRVRHEVHRYHGFLRFRRLENGIYYAAITPEHNVLPLLWPHFAARFADQRWFIHDTIRNSGLYYDGRHVRYLPKADPLSPATRPDPVEAAFEELFREYFRRIAIPERKNERLQHQRIPRRYRRYMLELEEPPSDRGHQPGEFGKIF